MDPADDEDRAGPGGTPGHLVRYEKWQDGALIATELQLLRRQHWSVTEFTRLLAEAGFTGIEVTASYQDGRPPGPDDATWTFRAHRA